MYILLICNLDNPKLSSETIINTSEFIIIKYDLLETRALGKQLEIRNHPHFFTITSQKYDFVEISFKSGKNVREGECNEGKIRPKVCRFKKTQK